MTRRILLRCDSTEDLYHVTAHSPISHAFLVSQHTCHQRLGHLGSDVVHRLVSNNVISCNKEKTLFLCHACQLGKHVRLPFVSSNTIVSFCFDIVYSDVWTSPIPSLSDPTTAMNITLALMAKAFKLNYSTPTNNNQRISSNPRNRQIAQPGNVNGYNDVQNVGNQVIQNVVQSNPNGNGNLVVARAEGNATGHNGNQIRSAEVHNYENCYDNEIFNMFTQEEQYTELLEPISKPHQVPYNDNNVIFEVSSVEQNRGTVEQHPTNVEEILEKSTVSSLLEEKKKWKSDFKIREDEILDKQIQLEKKIKELDNILVKTGQSIQTIHMLSPKRDSFYHTEQKTALGYQNPFYLKQAQKKQPSLYDGKVLFEKHDLPAVHDSKEIPQLAQEKKIASNLKFLNNLQPKWSRHVTIVHQTKDLHTADYTQLYDFLKYNQKEVDELKAEQLAKTQEPLALMENSNNPYTDSAPIYDIDGSTEVHENCDDNEIFNMFTQEEQYTELLELIPESHQVPQNDNDVISKDTSVEQGGETVEQHPSNFEETRALYESLYQNLAIEVKKVNSVNRKLKETNADLTTELARFQNQERCFEISQGKYDKLESVINNEDVLDDTTPSVARKFLNEEAAKFVGDFKSLANEADASLAKHKPLELEIERLLKAVVSQDIITIMQNASVVDTSDLQTKLERTKECFENCIIKKETEYAKLWNDWYKKCDECKYDQILYDKAYKDTQQKIKRLQAQLGDLKGANNDKVIAPGMFRINPSKTSREEKHVLNTVSASVRIKPITVSQPHVITKKDVNPDLNGLSSIGVDNTKTRRPQPRTKVVATVRRIEMPLPEVCTAIEEKKKKLPFRIQQYLQHEHYALWEVIEFIDSYKVPTNTAIDNTTTRKDDEQSGRIVTITTEDMQRKKNDVKARTTLLLSLLDENQLRFSKYKTEKELWVVILKTFGGNEATKKRKKNLLKQQYGNFKAEGSETLEQTFNRLQVI
nr:ribonuclease H-like domain-containing protein [Tanacetum cinerariifolium]